MFTVGGPKPINVAAEQAWP